MQTQLTKAIVGINQNIIRINKQNHTHTPKIGESIMKKKGKGRGFRVFENMLADGLPPTVPQEDDPEGVKRTLTRWAELITRAIEVNRSLVRNLVINCPAPISDLDSGSESDSGPPAKRTKFTVDRILFHD